MKFFGTIFNNLSICILLILLVNISLTHIKETESNMNLSSLNGQIQDSVKAQKFSAEQQAEFDNIKKPDAPTEMSEDIKFMQRKLTKAYLEAQNQINPRFEESMALSKDMMAFPEDKRQVGVPVNREG